MKKFAAAFTGLLLAAGFSTVSACEHYKSSYTMARAKTELPQGTFVLEMDGKRVMKRNLTPGQTVYTVQSNLGEILAQDLSTEELANQFPELHSRVNG